MSGGSNPPPPDGPMVHVGDHGKIHALYGYYTYHEYIRVSEQEEMIKAQIIFEGAKYWRGEVEKLNNLKFFTTVHEH